MAQLEMPDTDECVTREEYLRLTAQVEQVAAVVASIDTGLPPLRADDRRWMVRAACRGCNPNLFFPELGEQAPEAKAVCAHCPVQVECLEYGLRAKGGVWGGLTNRQRGRESARRRRNNKETS